MRNDLERRIVRGMIRRLKEQGWSVVAGNDGDGGWQPIRLEGEALELVFSVDQSWLRFDKAGVRHNVMLICGNGCDIISDWGYADGDPDGFNAAMDKVLDWTFTLED
jgi:hypothetical protein